MALASGFVQGGVELALGAVPVEGLLKTALGNTVFKKFLAKGTAAKMGQAIASRMAREGIVNLLEMPQQGLEEILQDGAANIFLDLAACQSDALSHDVDWNSINEIKNDLIDSFKGGIAMTLLMGIPAAGIKSVSTVGKAKALASFAKNTVDQASSRDAAIAALKNSELAETITDAELENYVDKERDWKAEADEAARLYTNPQFNPYAAIPTAENEADFRVGNNGHLAGMDAIKETGGKNLPEITVSAAVHTAAAAAGSTSGSCLCPRKYTPTQLSAD
jgi:hypothetical protein